MPAASSRPIVVHEPRTGGFPPLLSYTRQLWNSRVFAYELARSEIRANNSANLLGQLWQMLNPIMMALVYWFVFGFIFSRGPREMETYPILQESYLVYLVGGIFVFRYTIQALHRGANSVVSTGGLLLNSNFPRAIFPISTMLTEVQSYVPMLAVYLAFHLLSGFPLEATMLLAPWFVLLQTVFNLGLVLLFATSTVYFRDTTNLLPHVTRIWLYLSPVLWAPEEALSRGIPAWIMAVNPMTSYLRFWNDMVNGIMPSVTVFALTLGWSLGALVLGGAVFLRNEHEFAVRV